jgi:hypothetical protein
LVGLTAVGLTGSSLPLTAPANAQRARPTAIVSLRDPEQAMLIRRSTERPALRISAEFAR